MSCIVTPSLSKVLRCVAAALLLSVSCAASAQDSAVAAQVIVSPSLSSIPLDRSFLRAVFAMRVRQWPDGSPVRVFVLPDDDPLSDRFYRERLGMYSYVLRRAWDRMVFTGTGFAPTVVRSEAEMIERVRSTPGAIGYVSKRETSEFHIDLTRPMLVLVMNDAHE